MLKIAETLNDLNAWSVAFRLMLAVLMGLCIGANRERHGRAAGSRTHILVCLGSAITTLLGLFSVKVLGSTGDPMRIGAQVISGIGFLGVGTIMVRNHSHVIGLTTAAGLWATACIGLAVGAGFYWAVAVAFGVIMITMTVFTSMERRIRKRGQETYYVELRDVCRINALYMDIAHLLIYIEIVPARSHIPTHMGLELTVDSVENQQALLQRLQGCEEVVIAIPVR